MSDKICVLDTGYIEIHLLWNTFDLLDRILKIEKEADNAE